MHLSLVSSIFAGTCMFFAGKSYQEYQNKVISKNKQILIVEPPVQNLIKSNPIQQQPKTQNLLKTRQQQQQLKPFKVQSPIIHIEYPHFKIIYSKYHKAPVAVYERIIKDLMDGDAPRSRYFFVDQNIKDYKFQVNNTYYYESQAFKLFNLNRGHMAAAGNYSGSPAQKYLTFSFANVIPQDGTNNGGIWNSFQRYARNLLETNTCDEVEIISGPIYSKNSDNLSKKHELQNIYQTKSIVLLENGIMVPDKLYKIIKCNRSQNSYFNGFTFWNKETKDNSHKLKDFLTEIKEIENQTGLLFHLNGIESLEPIDPHQSLERTKYDYDYQFFYNLVFKSTNLKEMVDGLRRAKSQGIFIKFMAGDLLEQKILQFCYNELTSIQLRIVGDKQNRKSCQYILDGMNVNKKLWKLYSSELLNKNSQISDKLYKIYSESLEECKEKSLVENSNAHKYWKQIKQNLNKEKEQEIKNEQGKQTRLGFHHKYHQLLETLITRGEQARSNSQ